MSGTEKTTWHEANQCYLTTALSEVRHILERYIACKQGASGEGIANDENKSSLKQAALEMTPPPAIESLCAIFGLSSFERSVLLMCAGVELDSSFAFLFASAQENAMRPAPTFSLALAALPEAHWSALAPAGPLRYWRLIEFDNGTSLTQSLLRIDERILQYITGIQYLDERLAAFVEPITLNEDLVPSHHALAAQLVATWTQAAQRRPLPVLQLCGDEQASQRAIAANACAQLGLNLYIMSAAVLPLDPRDLQALMRLWEREAALTGSVLLLECGEMDTHDTAREIAMSRFIEGIRGALIVAGRERRSVFCRPLVTYEVHKPTTGEQRMLWSNILGQTAISLDGQLDMLVSQFNLTPSTVKAICTVALSRMADESSGSPADLGTQLLDICRVHSRPRLENLAQRIEPVATWDDLVLPEPQLQILREITIHVRQRMKVYEQWGFATKSSRGLGISALFTGASGTGKTMAAEVLANELRLDLYRIDLSQVVSKYIGETEKNLRQVFDAAEEGGAILLFDEADALFGKRSEVKDSHDRYANIEISYLLQRMEAYRGLAILTTNMKSALDSAFLRRIRFVVQFPFPDAAQRAEIWRRIIPAITPTEGLDMEKLARLNVAGGNIRNIALHAAFWAADLGEPVRMKHLLRATRVEYAKLEKTLTESEIKGWF